MSQPGGPGDPGDHSVRSLAEILREHGLETEFGTRPGRRSDDNDRAASADNTSRPLRHGPSDGRPASVS